MKNYKPILLMLFIVMASFSSCSDSSDKEVIPQPDMLAKQGKLANQTESFITPEYSQGLLEAKIYLTYEEVVQADESEPLLQADPRMIRYYSISDGVYTNASWNYGSSIADFDGATYSIMVVVAADTSGVIQTGDYHQTTQIITGESGSQHWQSIGKVGAIIERKGFYSIENNFPFRGVQTGDFEDSPVRLIGGTEVGSIMTVEFDGGVFASVGEAHPLYPEYYGNANLYVNAQVIDASTVIPSGARKAQGRPEIISRLLNLKTR